MFPLRTSIPLLVRPRTDLRREMFSLALGLKKASTEAPEDLQGQLEQNLRLQHPEADGLEIKRYVGNLLRRDESDLQRGLDYFEEKSRGRRL